MQINNAESNLQSKVKIVESPPLCPPPIPTPEGPDNVKVKLDPIKLHNTYMQGN